MYPASGGAGDGTTSGNTSALQEQPASPEPSTATTADDFGDAAPHCAGQGLDYDAEAISAMVRELTKLIASNATPLKEEEHVAIHGTDTGSVTNGAIASGHSQPGDATFDLKDASLIVGEPGKTDEFSLWLGAVEDAIDLELLRRRKVSAIVNMAVNACRHQKDIQCENNSRKAPFLSTEDLRWSGVEFNVDWYSKGLCREDTRYLGLNTDDREDYPIWQVFDEVTTFLRRCREENRGVLVHCISGINRSACACTAFLMRDGFGLKAAVGLVSRRRAGVLRNAGFLQQLCLHGRGTRSGSQTSNDTRECVAEDDPVSQKTAKATPSGGSGVVVKRGGSARWQANANRSVRREGSGLSLCSSGSIESAASSASTASSLRLQISNRGLTGSRLALERLAALRSSGGVRSSGEKREARRDQARDGWI